jgi:hypothetical protein
MVDVGAGLGNPGFSEKVFSLFANWQLGGFVFELGGPFGHSIFKGSGLLHAASFIRHDECSSAVINVPVRERFDLHTSNCATAKFKLRH